MSTDIPVRVRFAPSPTGHLHIGSLRSALFNWLFARHHGGVFLLRIEDTDLERSKHEYTEALRAGLNWAGIVADEPILIQSSRVPEHRAVAHGLVEQGKAYRCYCTQDELSARLGGHAGSEGEYRKYDGFCWKRQQGGWRGDPARPHVIRFRLPHGLDELRAGLEFNDIIRGDVQFQADQFDDFVLIRSDHMPTYNFAVVVDDAFMRISHVIRGEEHLVNTPKQIWLYHACGWKIPQFAHVPLILGPSGQKLSKRDAATSVVDYIRDGFLADALCNYLVRLGWAHGDQEIFSRDEMIELFDLAAVGKKGAIFDIVKLRWLNSVYIKKLSIEQIELLLMRDLGIDLRHRYPKWEPARIHHGIELYRERVLTLMQFVSELDRLYERPVFDRSTIRTLCSHVKVADSIGAIRLFLQTFVTQSGVQTRDAYQAAIKLYAAQHGLGMRDVAPLVRYALVGTTESIGIGDCISMVGWEEAVARLKLFEHEVSACI